VDWVLVAGKPVWFGLKIGDTTHNLLALAVVSRQKQDMVFNRTVLTVIALSTLGGCVSPLGNGVLRSDGDLPRNAHMVMAPSSDPLSVMQVNVRDATQTALTRLGYQFGRKGEFVVDHAYSERPLSVSFETDGGLHSGVAKLPNFAICAQHIQRLTLVVTEQGTGRPVYQGQAEITQCTGAKEDNAMRLANAAVATLQPALAAP
jgi:hypothetical protein